MPASGARAPAGLGISQACFPLAFRPHSPAQLLPGDPWGARRERRHSELARTSLRRPGACPGRGARGGGADLLPGSRRGWDVAGKGEVCKKCSWLLLALQPGQAGRTRLLWDMTRLLHCLRLHTLSKGSDHCELGIIFLMAISCRKKCTDCMSVSARGLSGFGELRRVLYSGKGGKSFHAPGLH